MTTISIVMSVRERVTGSRLLNILTTESELNSDVPRSPRSALPSQSRYRTNNGSLRPSLSLVSSMAAGVAFSPASAVAASPGIRSTSE